MGSHHGIHHEAAGDPALVVVRHTNTADNPEGDRVNITDGGGNLSSEQCLPARPGDDFALAPGSPCVDAGVGPCDDEPRSDDGGCARDLGHLGGAAQAQALPAGPAIVPPEVCNDVDDDGDGDIDEGFDLAVDPAHCGACDAACALDDAVAACVAGQCVVARCDPGFEDDNHRDGDGCEDASEGRVWVVDGGAPGTEGEEGAWRTLAEALEVAEEGDTVLVRPGVYPGSVEVAVDGVTVVGDDPLTTFVVGDGGPAILVSGDGSGVHGLGVHGGASDVGMRLRCRERCAAVGNRIRRVRGADRSVDAVSGLAMGIEALDGEEHLIAYNEVGAIQGGHGVARLNTPWGGAAEGVRLLRTDGARVVGNRIRDAHGGRGPTAYHNESGSGGWATGIRLSASAHAEVGSNRVDFVRGGPAGWENHQNTAGGRGGAAVGLGLDSGAEDNHLADNRLTDLRGGPGRLHAGPPGNLGPAWGAHLADDSEANALDRTNTVNGDPIVYLHGAVGDRIEGLVLLGEAPGTNYGRIVVLDSEDVFVGDNELAGWPAPGGYPQGDAPTQITLLVRGGQGVELVGNTVRDLTGGRGGGGHNNRGGLRGGHVVGIALDATADAVVADNVVIDLTGGPGGVGGREAAGGRGGDALAIRLSAAPGASVRGNVIARIEGGADGVAGAQGGGWGEEGGAVGLRIEASAGVAVSHLLAYELQGRWVHGVAVGGESPGVSLTYSTLHDLVGEEVGDGVHVEAGGVLTAAGIIVSSVHRHALWSARADAPAACVEGGLRLAGGANEREGRVELCDGGAWGTVCDDSWEAVDAQVVCGQLGFAREGAQATIDGSFGQGAGVILLDDVACAGDEARLVDCGHNGIGISNCGHHEDAGVVCQEGPGGEEAAPAVTVAYSDLFDSGQAALHNVEEGDGVIDLDPLFTDPGGEDFSLQDASPCIDSAQGVCEAEPDSGGGSHACDMGHLGDTADAWPGDGL